MMKTIATALAVLSVAGATQAGADVYKGRIKWIAVSPECSGGPNLGDRDNVVFHQFKDVASERFTAVNVFWAYGSDAQRINANVGGTLTNVDDARRIGSEAYNPLLNQPTPVSKFSVTSTTASNGTITVKGQIQNPWADSAFDDCIVDYLLTGIKS